MVDGCGHSFVYRATIDHLKSVFACTGSDSWWSLPLDKLLPDNVIAQVTFPTLCAKQFHLLLAFAFY